MTRDDKGGVGVWNTLKIDDVIYGQPLMNAILEVEDEDTNTIAHSYTDTLTHSYTYTLTHLFTGTLKH